MTDSIHQSTLNMALRCGEQFRRRHIEGHIIPPGIAAGRGTGVHKANEVNLQAKVKTKEDLPLSDLQDVARDGYVHAFRNGVFIPKENQGEKDRLMNDGLNDAVRCTKVYHEKVAPSIHPIEIEQPFRIDVGLELPLAGRMDYQEEPVVGDLKTTTQKWAKGRIESEIQVPFYSFAHEHQKGVRPEFRYHVLIARRGKNGNPTSEDYQPLSHTCTDKDYNALFAKVGLFIQMLKKGLFPPANPTSWWCSENWCGYFSTCRYQGAGERENWI